MRSVMKHDFSKVPAAEIQRSSFDRSHGYKTTLDAGYLYPIFVEEALPGDSFKVRLNTFARMATPIFPLMDNLKADVFFFAVPYRLVWNNFVKMMGEQDDPGDSIDYVVPTIVDAPATTYTVAEGSLGDYLGLPTQVALASSDGVDSGVCSFWHRAYNLVWNEWMRDENLQDSVVVDKDDGPDDSADYVLLRRGKRHDYFTSALPWPQKGSAISLPLGSSAPIYMDNTTAQAIGVYATQYSEYRRLDSSGSDLLPDTATQSAAQSLYADLSAATAATINDLREAFQLQKLIERDARGGTRYTEVVRSHFNVVSDDARLQRPEFLGGGTADININPVAQTSETNTTAQGNLSAFGTFSHGGVGFTKSFTEHCLILGLINIRADLTYQQGVPRMFSRSTRYDFYWPALAHIGEQEILSKEIYADGSANDYDIFGYQERYAEYRYKPSLVTGKFRSNATGTLDAWHLSQDFASRPELNATFIEDNPPVDRVIATPDEPQFILDCYFNFHAARPMPMFGVPGLIDHF
jgi:hypothetical protein